MKKYALFFVAATLSATPEASLLTSFAHALTLLEQKAPALWQPESWAEWLTQKNLISAEATVPNTPPGTTATLYRVRVVRQEGVTCGFHASWNLGWFMAALGAPNETTAKNFVGTMMDEKQLKTNLAGLKKRTGITDDLCLFFEANKIIARSPYEEHSFEGWEVWPQPPKKNISPALNPNTNFDFQGFYTVVQNPHWFPDAYRELIIERRGTLGIFMTRMVGILHYFAFALERNQSDYSFFILDSLDTDGPIPVESYAQNIRKLITAYETPPQVKK